MCLLPVRVFAQTGQPAALCADVGPNGEVLLSWEYDAATSATVYDIFRDQGLGFVGPLTSISFPDLSYNDVGAGADQNSIRYYVTARDAPIGSIADTV
ncbi:MAG TPA: hypothetical protein VJ949_07275, partial [Cryomorphaceae bacterium]|nr:hypothetical protein [Cryomorphaceae bacterium]